MGLVFAQRKERVLVLPWVAWAAQLVYLDSVWGPDHDTGLAGKLMMPPSVRQ